MAYSKYNANDVTLMVKGVYITGLGEDMVSGEKDEDLFTTSVGAQGDVMKSEVNNPLGTITVTVQTTSPQYKHLLSLQHESEPFPIWCTDKGLGRRFGGTMASLKKPPEEARGSEGEEVEFEFQVFDYEDETI